jgi:hypothetical protein
MALGDGPGCVDGVLALGRTVVADAHGEDRGGRLAVAVGGDGDRAGGAVKRRARVVAERDAPEQAAAA